MLPINDTGTTALASRRGLRTLAMVAAGLLVFELSANPSLGVAVACLKFGWDDVHDALWLRRNDPWRGRGRACFWMYASVGSLRASLIAFIGAVAMAIFAESFGVAWGWPRRLLRAQLLGAVGVGIAGLAIASTSSLLAVLFALVSRVRIWVGPEARLGRETGGWPPLFDPSFPSPRPNRAVPVVLITVAGLVLILIPAFILMVVGAFLTIVPAWAGQGAPVVLAFLFLIGSAALTLGLRDVIDRRVLARSPAECWPDAADFSRVDDEVAA